MKNPKNTSNLDKNSIFASRNVEKAQEKPITGTPLVGIDAIATVIGRGRTTVIEYRQLFPDFPVSSDPNCVWYATREALIAWKEAHPTLFKSREELKAERSRSTRRW